MARLIPELPEARLRELAERVQPLLFPDGDAPVLPDQPVDLHAPLMAAPRGVPAEGFAPLCTITTFHPVLPIDAPVRFSPTAAEVLAQLPAHLADGAAAFSVGWRTGPMVTDPHERRSYWSAHTTLYVRSDQRWEPPEDDMPLAELPALSGDELADMAGLLADGMRRARRVQETARDQQLAEEAAAQVRLRQSLATAVSEARYSIAAQSRWKQREREAAGL